MITLREEHLVLTNKIQALSPEIGNTPISEIKHIFSKPGVNIYAKHEWKQLSGSVKIRAAYAIMRQAIEDGTLNADKTLLDATSGNTGIAYATIGDRIGLKVVLCIPENASSDRKIILQDLGAELIFTSRFEGTDGAQMVAKELSEKFPGKYFYADQYANENNWKAHYNTTAEEIYSALPQITHFVAGLGTTGTFIGTGRRLKELNPEIRLISLQPDSPLHGMEGWKHLQTAIVPKIYDFALADENLEVNTDNAYEIIKAAAKHENLLLSPSSAANIAGAIQVAEKLSNGTLLTILPDNSDRYKDIMDQLSL